MPFAVSGFLVLYIMNLAKLKATTQFGQVKISKERQHRFPSGFRKPENGSRSS